MEGSQYLLLDAGSGGMASHRLIQTMFARAFSNPILDRMDDAALVHDLSGPLAMSTDSYTVTPLFFPGGSIGTLAIHGTVNDVAMLGAKPRYLSCAFILEEGLALADLESVVQDMGRAAKEAQVAIVTGDTKVVPKGGCDSIFITTTGIGSLLVSDPPSGHNARVGDSILVSGSIGDHGMCILASREALPFETNVRSDSAPLAAMLEPVLTQCSVRVLRDPTRGGVATTLKEIALQSNVSIRLQEEALPIHESVRAGCDCLGLDPLYLANEGKCLCFVPKEEEERALRLLRESPYGREACVIGCVDHAGDGRVVLETKIGGERQLGMLEGAQLPRIC